MTGHPPNVGLPRHNEDSLPMCYRCGQRKPSVRWIELTDAWRWTDRARITWTAAWLCGACVGAMNDGLPR